MLYDAIKKILVCTIAMMGVLPVQASIDIERLSLREKIGQMLIVGFEGSTANQDSEIVQAIQQDNIGGVILFDYNFQTKVFDKNIKSPEQVQSLNKALQTAAVDGNKLHHRPDLPLLISVDYEGGKVNRLKSSYGFPNTISAQVFSQLSKIDALAESQKMAHTLKSNGFNVDFAPVLDVNVNPENPIIGKLERSYSSDPALVTESSSILASTLKSQGIACAYKHFPGHGSSTGDSHLGFVDVTDTWQTYELQPFQSIAQHLDNRDMVMTAHIINRKLDESGLPATLSHKVLTELLRNELGFEGVIITDDMQMKAISDHYGLEESLVLAINAGADMFIFGNQLSGTPVAPSTLIDLIEKNVRAGHISEARINESVYRIVGLKESL